MVQTRVEAAALVVTLQKTAVVQGVALYAVAAMAAIACSIAAIVLIAVAVPEDKRVMVLSIVVLALLGLTVFAALRAGKQVRRDTALIADFMNGLRLDFAMVNLALKDPETDGAEEFEKREQAKQDVREAAAVKAATPSTAEDGAVSAAGPSASAAAAAMSAAGPDLRRTSQAAGGVMDSAQNEALARTAMRDGDVSTTPDAAPIAPRDEPLGSFAGAAIEREPGGSSDRAA